MCWGYIGTMEKKIETIIQDAAVQRPTDSGRGSGFVFGSLLSVIIRASFRATCSKAKLYSPTGDLSLN